LYVSYAVISSYWYVTGDYIHALTYAQTYFMLQNFFKNKNISKKLKLILKNTIIDKTLTYALETSTL